MKIKPGARLDHVDWRLWAAAIVAERCFNERGYYFMITGGSDFVASRGPDTRHHPRFDTAGKLIRPGLAIDGRIWHVPLAERRALRDEVQEGLGPDFDVVLKGESHGGPKGSPDHMHAEWDPD